MMNRFLLVISLSAAPAMGMMRPLAFVASTSPKPTTQLNKATERSSVVLITGASQGLGQAMAYELARKGQKVIVNYFPGLEEDADNTVREIEELGGEGLAIAADVTNEDQVNKMFDDAIARFGKVDVLINNAGITKDNLALRMKPEEFATVIKVNLGSDFVTSKAFINHVDEKQESGRIINIASVVGQIGNPGQANYAASKGGVIGLTKSLAKELAPKIKVNAVCPGFIETPMTAKLTEEQIKKSVEAIPLHRLGKPSEVAAMVRFLAVDEGAEYITGHCFDVDGGIGIAAA